MKKNIDSDDQPISISDNVDSKQNNNSEINKLYDKIKIVNWNIGGAKYLEEPKDKRDKIKKRIQNEIIELIHAFKPDIITLQEIVRYGKKNEKEKAEDIIDIDFINKEIYHRYGLEILDELVQYEYFSFPLVENEKLSSKAKWDKVMFKEKTNKSGEKEKFENWPTDSYFAQGNAIMFRKNLPHFPVWDLSKIEDPKKNRIPSGNHAIEQINLDNGLYFGDRDTEPRAALIAHFIVNPINNSTYEEKKGDIKEYFIPYDIFVVNVHLTTLMGEREGIPEIDLKASKIRLTQLNVIIDGIISRYNNWRRIGYKIRNKDRTVEDWETYTRHEPLWIIAGDFNFTPESEEYRSILGINFKDVIPNKKNGSKAKGAGNKATLTLDYVFAGPKYLALDPIIIDNEINANSVHDHYKASDHKPMDATIPIVIPLPKKK